MITTSDEGIAERARTLRFHGSHDKVTYELVGYNSRLDALQAAILRVQLPHLDAWADGRRAAGRHYEEAGLGELVRLPQPTDGSQPAWHLYVADRPTSRAWNRRSPPRRSATRPTTARPSTARPRCAHGARAWSCRAPKKAARTHLAIPMSPGAHPGAGRSGGRGGPRRGGGGLICTCNNFQ